MLIADPSRHHIVRLFSLGGTKFSPTFFNAPHLIRDPTSTALLDLVPRQWHLGGSAENYRIILAMYRGLRNVARHC
jgi:hypothetical protein